MEAAFFTGNCDANTRDVTSLANIAVSGARVLRSTPCCRNLFDNTLWRPRPSVTLYFASLVSWTLSALMEAEQLGLIQSSVRAQLNSPLLESKPELRQFLGQRYGTGSLLGLAPHWTVDVVQAVGSYGEMFDRDMGDHSPLHLNRGENRLWTEGGLQFPLPLADH